MRFVKSCEIAVSDSGEVLFTVVGSCVCVCIHDPVSRMGGMAHFLLPNRDAYPASAAREGKFGDLSIPALIRRLESLGASRNSMVAKIAGGARIVMVSDVLDVPRRNVETARRVLLEEGVPLVSQDTGGERGRKVVFDTATGIVTVNDGRIL